MSFRSTTAMSPGHPGRGFDPTTHFTDMQWYLYHQNNIAYFGAFLETDVSMGEALSRVRQFVEALPHAVEGFRGSKPGVRVPDAVLTRCIEIETVETLSGLPDAWLNSPAHVYDDADLPFFRVRIARLAGGADAEGRRGFMLVRLSHALAEGQDSALLARSQNAAHPEIAASAKVPAHTAFFARLLGGLAAAMHLLVARLWDPHPGDIVLVTRALPRRLLFTAARQLGVKQRALLAALAAEVFVPGAASGGRRRFTSTYSSIDHGGGANRDSFMRMRMRLARFQSAASFAGLARSMEREFETAEARESGFNAEMNAAATRAHRRLSRLVPWAYAPRVFRFMPYDIVFGLIPPHRLGGPLMQGVMEPVYAGALVPGIVGCVVVPGREQITFNFSLRAEETDRVAAFDARIAALTGEPSA